MGAKESKHRVTKGSKHRAKEMDRATEKPLVELTTRTNGELLLSEASEKIKCAFQNLKNPHRFGVIDSLLGLSGPLPTKKAEIERLNNVLHIDSQDFAHIIMVSSAFIQKHNLRRNPKKWVAILGPLVG